MPKHSSRKDLNQLAASIMNSVTSDIPSETSSSNPQKQKNPSAVALGRLGGLKGGKARAKKLTKEQRIEIAKRGATKRWGNRE